jgi:predicted secreted protein
MTKCKKHPRYKAIMVPKVPCPECCEMWLDKHRETASKEQVEKVREMASSGS